MNRVIFPYNHHGAGWPSLALNDGDFSMTRKEDGEIPPPWVVGPTSPWVVGPPEPPGLTPSLEANLQFYNAFKTLVMAAWDLTQNWNYQSFGEY